MFFPRRGIEPPLDYPVILNRNSPQAAGLVNWYPPLASREIYVYLIDRAGKEFTGTLAGNAAYALVPQMGHVLTLDGTGDYVTLPNLGVSGASARTVAAWIWTDTTASLRCLYFSGAASAGLQFCVYINVSSAGDLYFAGNTYDQRSTNGSLIAVNTWTHVAVTFTGGTINSTTIALFVNGFQVAQTSVGSGTANTTNSNYRIGSDTLSAGRDWDGYIGDFRIYNRALSPAEIFQLYDPATRWDLYAPKPRLWAYPELIGEGNTSRAKYFMHYARLRQ